MNFQNVIVTGANRGIGLEFIKQFSKQSNPPKNLIATTRSASDALNQLKSNNSNLHVLTYDAGKYDEYDSFVKNVKQIIQNDGLDLLINNAGIMVRGNLETTTPKDILTNVDINAVAPFMLTKALLSMLKDSAAANRKTVVANITSKMGSIADNSSGGNYPYRASKAAMNMIGKSLSVDLQKDKIIVLLIHPGWVQTDMGGQGLINTETSTTGMMKVIEESDMSSTGAFKDYSGKTIPW